MACHPPPSTFKKQAAVLRQLKVFNRGVLNHVQAIRATNAVGCTSMEPWEPLEVCGGMVQALRQLNMKPPPLQHPQDHLASPSLQAPQRSEEEEAALRAALSALRLRSKQDSLPCRITPGVFIGGAAAARNLKGLRKRGITHILNAAPAVPCHFKDNPEGCFTYLALPLFDDPEAGACLRIASCPQPWSAAAAAARLAWPAWTIICQPAPAGTLTLPAPPASP
jgi:hypothetical protein